MLKKTLKLFIKIFIFIFLAASVLPYAIVDTVEEEFDRDVLYENSEFIVFNDINIHYRTWEPDKDKNGYVLLVHGFGGSTYSWRNTIDTLTELGYFTVALDLPGFGYSDRVTTEDGELNEMVSELIHKISETKNDNKIEWNLIGHSLGAKVISEYALFDDNIDKLIFVDGAFQTNNNPLEIILKYPPAKEWMKHIISKIYLTEDRIRDILTKAYGREPSEDELKNYIDPLLIKGTTNNLIDMTMKKDKVKIENLNNIDSSMYAIWGEDDTITPIKNMSELKSTLKEIDTYVIQDSAHCPMETHSNEFNIILEKILD